MIIRNQRGVTSNYSELNCHLMLILDIKVVLVASKRQGFRQVPRTDVPRTIRFSPNPAADSHPSRGLGPVLVPGTERNRRTPVSTRARRTGPTLAHKDNPRDHLCQGPTLPQPAVDSVALALKGFEHFRIIYLI